MVFTVQVTHGGPRRRVRLNAETTGVRSYTTEWKSTFVRVRRQMSIIETRLIRPRSGFSDGANPNAGGDRRALMGGADHGKVRVLFRSHRTPNSCYSVGEVKEHDSVEKLRASFLVSPAGSEAHCLPMAPSLPPLWKQHKTSGPNLTFTDSITNAQGPSTQEDYRVQDSFGLAFEKSITTAVNLQTTDAASDRSIFHNKERVYGF
ncbi:hypothetical protein SKAU_G00429310 [Synaphobranchus kaupii]|uniref:Uncharacterized protein n=1 Tax=Synaphobranchus kaupii TaxID=118154 RepID=A0A9Q1I9Z1_SYNKA|nr:hypothetical protein SKAU_G00429310 [Synaphobranchus kaupii]